MTAQQTGHTAQVMVARQDLGLVRLMLAPYARDDRLHEHAAYTEGGYVIEGLVAVTIADQTITLNGGAAYTVPPGAPHSCWNPTSQPAVVLLAYAPGGDQAALLALVECANAVGVPPLDTS